MTNPILKAREEADAEFEKIVAEKRGILARNGHVLIPILFEESEVKSIYHSREVKMLEQIRKEIQIRGTAMLSSSKDDNGIKGYEELVWVQKFFSDIINSYKK